MKDIDNKIRGCIFGGAIGDALGYPIEFCSEREIVNKYNSADCLDLVLNNKGKAVFSDDTQMTLFTAAALGDNDIDDFINTMHKYYIMWLKTQIQDEKIYGSWITTVDDLYVRRAPGNTCLSSLMSGKVGTIDNKINTSKGCGGVMRVAPIGCIYEDSVKAFKFGADAAAITHGHILGYVPAGAFSMIISKLVYTDEGLVDIIKNTCRYMLETYGNNDYVMYFVNLIIKSIKLASNKNITDLDAINQIGEGWVAEEALAISLYCLIKYRNNFEKAVQVASFHRGDSDSTGAITGNLVGAYLGYNKIPERWIDLIEQVQTLNKAANILIDNKVHIK